MSAGTITRLESRLSSYISFTRLFYNSGLTLASGVKSEGRVRAEQNLSQGNPDYLVSPMSYRFEFAAQPYAQIRQRDNNVHALMVISSRAVRQCPDCGKVLRKRKG